MLIYDDYDDEPEDIFLPLSEEQYCDFYELEMGGFTEDLPFFRKHLPEHGHILELGCGTGRVGRALAHQQRQLTGIDISVPMLEKAASYGNRFCRYVGMDMAQLAFQTRFAAVIIPYNTLNLLPGPGSLSACLTACHSLLNDYGVLTVQLFVPHRTLMEQVGQKTTFQFQILKDPEGGRVIKEIRRTYDAQTETIHIEERYRVRPTLKDRRNEDFSHRMDLSAWQEDRWCSFLTENGFSVDHRYGDYDLSPFSPGRSSCLLLAARCR